MSVSTRRRALVGLAALLTACQVSSEPVRRSAENPDLFDPRPSDWRPLSTSHLFFYDAGPSTGANQSRKTYVETLRSEVFQGLYGNLVPSAGDYRVSGLTGDAN